MINVMQMLDQLESQSGGKLPEWLATHPNPGNRIEHINSVLAQTKTDFGNATVNTQGYERRLDGMIFGMNPREGFFKGTEFYHPDLKLRMSFPSGWQTANSKQASARARRRGTVVNESPFSMIRREPGGQDDSYRSAFGSG